MFRLTVEDVFSIKGRGTVATGRVESGSVGVGDQVSIDGRLATVDAVEMFRKVVDRANEGDNVGLLFKALGKDDVPAGAVITGGGVATPAAAADPAPASDLSDAMRDSGLGAEQPRGLKRFFGRG